MESLQPESVQIATHSKRKDQETSIAVMAGKISLGLELLGSIVAIIVGFAVFLTTGLNDAVDSVVLKVTLGAIVPYIYLAIFHAGLKSKRKPRRKICCGKFLYR